MGETIFCNQNICVEKPNSKKSCSSNNSRGLLVNECHQEGDKGSGQVVPNVPCFC